MRLSVWAAAAGAGLALAGPAAAQSATPTDVRKLFGKAESASLRFVPVDPATRSIVPLSQVPGAVGGTFPGSLFRPLPANPFQKLLPDRPLPTPFTGPTAGPITAPAPSLPNQNTIRGVERQIRRSRRREKELQLELQQQGRRPEAADAGRA